MQAWGLSAVCGGLFCACLLLALVPATHSRAAPGTTRANHPLEQAARQWLASLDAVPGQWQAVQGMTWFGRAVWLREFALTQGLTEAAQQFTQAAPALDRVLGGPASLLLSATVGSLHLVVQLQRSARGVEGFASALELTAAAQGEAHAVPDGAWLAHATQVHASQWRLPDGSRARQSIHVVPEAPAALRVRLGKVLEQHGWREGTPTTGASGREWQRGADRLLLLPDVRASGSLLYQVLIEGKTP